MQVSIREAADMLRVSEQTIRRRIHTGELPATQMNTPQGFIWMVELSDDPPTVEVDRTAALIASLESRIAAQDAELAAKNQQISELHVLLQQAALPAPRNNHPWWRFWRSG
jgi:predicted DNA-binding transcriptional regulator YafY